MSPELKRRLEELLTRTAPFVGRDRLPTATEMQAALSVIRADARAAADLAASELEWDMHALAWLVAVEAERALTKEDRRDPEILAWLLVKITDTLDSISDDQLDTTGERQRLPGKIDELLRKIGDAESDDAESLDDAGGQE